MWCLFSSLGALHAGRNAMADASRILLMRMIAIKSPWQGPGLTSRSTNGRHLGVVSDPAKCHLSRQHVSHLTPHCSHRRSCFGEMGPVKPSNPVPITVKASPLQRLGRRSPSSLTQQLPWHRRTSSAAYFRPILGRTYNTRPDIRRSPRSSSCNRWRDVGWVV